MADKLKRGEYETLYEQEKELVVVRWRDNANVPMLSNHSFVEPLAKARRYDRTQKKYMNTDVPRMVKEYNQGMGGVGLHDNALGNYRIGIRSKKWWWPLFTNALSNMMVNAWKLHCFVAKSEGTKPLPQVEFRSQVTRGLLLADKPAFDESSASTSAIPTSARLPNQEAAKHFPAKRC